MSTARLVDTGPVCAPTSEGLTWWPCRTWVTDSGLAWSVITEENPEGPRLSNAAEHLVGVLSSTRPGYEVRLVEHRPADGVAPTRYTERVVDTAGEVRWQDVTADELLDLFGPTLHTTDPTRKNTPK